LAKTEAGRQLLTLLGEEARLRIREALSAELARGSAEDVDRLRRVLNGRDLVARERAAAELPHAEATLAKWQRARADYQHRRELIEYTMRDLMRELSR